MTDKEVIQKVEDAYKEAMSGWDLWIREAEEDDRMYLNDQWKSSDASKLLKEGRPALSINKIKKIVDLTTGYEQQNRTDIKYRPENKADAFISDVYTELAKYVTTRSNAQYNISYAFADTCRTGLGWMVPEINYYEEPVDGDVEILCENKYRILIDPYTTDPRLTDCGYIVRFAWLTKEKAKELYPEFKSNIKKMTGMNLNKFTVQAPTNIQDRGERVQVIEMWERTQKKRTILFDVMTQEMRIWDGGKKKLEYIMQANPEMFQNVVVFERFIPEMNLMTTINDEAVAYNDRPPLTHSQSSYPFIPMFGYYVPNFNDWKWKVQGIVRVLKDPQRELNKTRSLQMEAMYSAPSSGWVYREGVLDDPEELNKVGARQKIKMVEGGLGDGLWPVPPVNMQPAFVQLEQQHKEDMRDAGPDTNLMGMAGSQGLSPDTSGVALQLVQRKELTSLQNLFDGKALAMRLLGKQLVEIFNKWSRKKIENIIGRSLPQDWDTIKTRAKMDTIIDEKTSSPTYRMANFADMKSLVQHGVQVPPAVLRELSDIPEETKEMWDKMDQQSQQQEQQMRMIELNLEKQRIDAMYRGELQKTQMGIKGKKELEALNQAGEKEIKEMDIMGKLELENMRGYNQLKVAKSQPRSSWQNR